MWVKFVFLFQFIILSTSSSLRIDNNGVSGVMSIESESDLPNIWEDEAVNRMVREMLARNLFQEHEQRRTRRQYKRDIHSTVTSSSVMPSGTVIARAATKTTRKSSAGATQKTKKPSKVTQAGNKNKNRVTTTVTTKATVKPKTKPIVSTTTAANFGSVNASSKIKPTTQPTKYHYYPHNQHPYFLPECAIQQVCNAVYVRLNYTQPLCVCPPRYRDPCSESLNEDDNHTITLVGNANKRAVTLAKTCEQGNELRDCRAPRDWSILALQNTRTGKSHYLVICKCPSHFRLEGPLPHDQPTYAGLPGINVYGMLCVPYNAPSSAKWRPVIHTSYRSKNTTIEATSDSPTSSTSVES